MLAFAVAVLMLLGSALQAATCEDIDFREISYTICTVDTAEDLRLFLYDDDGKVFGHFGTLDWELRAKKQRLGFAMNAGMYHEDRSPVGHYVENSTQIMRVIPNAGPGNFGMHPNGILCLREGYGQVIETLKFIKDNPTCTYATQSGPMLVIDGQLHPRFLVDSTSRYIRNGVGARADGGQLVFAISNDKVTFHEFGSLFRDHLKLPQALFLDGNISRLYAPEIDRKDLGFRIGPIIGTVLPVE